MPDIKDERICEECELRLPIEKFPRIQGTRRRHTCNRCTRGRKEAARHGMTVEEFLSYSEGPCCFCGNSETRAYFFGTGTAPAARVCAKCAMAFRPFKNFQRLILCHEILLRFPFWIRILKDNHLRLFSDWGDGD